MYSLKEPETDVNRIVVTDIASGRKITNSIDKGYRFEIIWNDGGFKNYFCPEPMTAQIDAPNLKIPASESGYAELAPNEEFSVSQWFYTE
jgi:aldose 1-epimerase